VLTVARAQAAHHHADGVNWAVDGDVLVGLLRSDVAVTAADQHGPLVWNADLLVPGLSNLWRVLMAVPAARAVGRQPKFLAQAGAVLSGLLLATRRGRRRGPSLMRRLAFSPVNTAAGTALLVGWGGAIRVATVPSPAPRARVPWHALTGVEALSRLEGAPRRTQTALSRAAGTASEIVHTVTRSPVMTPAWWSIRLLSAVRAELNDPFTPILAVGAAASAIVGSTVMLRW